MKPKEIELEQIARYLFTIKLKILPQVQKRITIGTRVFTPDLVFINDQSITIIEVKSKIIKAKETSLFFKCIQPLIKHLLGGYSNINFILFTDQHFTTDEKKEIFDYVNRMLEENRTKVKVEVWDRDVIKNELINLDENLGELFESGHYGLIIDYLQIRSLEKNFIKYSRLLGLRAAVSAIMARNMTHIMGFKLLSPELLSISPILKETLLQRHFSPKIAAKLAKDIDEGKFKFESGKRYYNLIFLYADLKNFSNLVNNTRDYSIIHTLIGKFYSNVREIIFKYEGMFDKFIGDAVIAIFGFPYYNDGTVVSVIKCAREIISGGYQVEKEWLNYIDVVRPEIGVRVGISAGDGVIIKTGSEMGIFSEITIISNELNLAARLEETAPVNGVRVSNRYYNMLDDAHKIHLRSEKIEIKGFNEKMLTWIEENSLKYLT